MYRQLQLRSGLTFRNNVLGILYTTWPKLFFVLCFGSWKCEFENLSIFFLFIFVKISRNESVLLIMAPYRRHLSVITTVGNEVDKKLLTEWCKFLILGDNEFVRSSQQKMNKGVKTTCWISMYSIWTCRAVITHTRIKKFWCLIEILGA